MAILVATNPYYPINVTTGHFISPNGFARATEPVDPKMCRVVPEDIRNLNPHDLYVPPNVTCWSEYVKPGDEIELQWGNSKFCSFCGSHLSSCNLLVAGCC